MLAGTVRSNVSLDIIQKGYCLLGSRDSALLLACRTEAGSGARTQPPGTCARSLWPQKPRPWPGASQADSNPAGHNFVPRGNGSMVLSSTFSGSLEFHL